MTREEYDLAPGFNTWPLNSVLKRYPIRILGRLTSASKHEYLICLKIDQASQSSGEHYTSDSTKRGLLDRTRRGPQLYEVIHLVPYRLFVKQILQKAQSFHT
jgi:hypothetical protein